jgi:hypothetical protein
MQGDGEIIARVPAGIEPAPRPIALAMPDGADLSPTFKLKLNTANREPVDLAR